MLSAKIHLRNFSDSWYANSLVSSTVKLDVMYCVFVLLQYLASFTIHELYQICISLFGGVKSSLVV